MIHYQLQCGQDHGFDGWFKGSAAFEEQAARGLLECPVCGDRAVRRALMAPAVPRKSNARAIISPAEPKPDAAPAAEPAPDATPTPAVPWPPEAPRPIAVAGERMPDQVRAVLQRLRSEVEKNCDYVGPNFAEEARRMHRGETEHRGIYGETTPDQAESLAEDGIEVSRIPWVPRADG